MCISFNVIQVENKDKKKKQSNCSVLFLPDFHIFYQEITPDDAHIPVKY